MRLRRLLFRDLDHVRAFRDLLDRLDARRAGAFRRGRPYSLDL